jgi:hypothetical protein
MAEQCNAGRLLQREEGKFGLFTCFNKEGV